MCAAPAPGPDQGDIELVAGRVGPAEHTAGDDAPSGSGCRGLKELASFHAVVLLSAVGSFISPESRDGHSNREDPSYQGDGKKSRHAPWIAVVCDQLLWRPPPHFGTPNACHP